MSETRRWWIAMYDGTAWDTKEQAQARDETSVVWEVSEHQHLAAARREVETVTKEREEARAAMEDVRQAIGNGCGDTSCRFVKPKGMATNGGCRCVNKPGVVAAFAKAYRALAQEAGDGTA